MNTRPSPFQIVRSWKALYRAAIFETDRDKLAWRLAAAEKAVLERGRELFRQAGSSEERQEREEVNTALYCLRAYKNARSHIEAA
jgi:hypothetical protein